MFAFLPFGLMYGALIYGSIARYGGLLEAVAGSGRTGGMLAAALMGFPFVLLWLAGLALRLLSGRKAVLIRSGSLVFAGQWRVPLGEIQSVQDQLSKATPWEGGRDVIVELRSGRRRTISTALLEGDARYLAGEITAAITAAL
ncbi:hypothetical protein [Caulobacter sp. 17J65-9]|uniref:hypothetical protein n=1 Tax=Caulobacter sp. 17J65-9 TaxID=2709382 RepID=UPI0013CCD2C7|nr:hypothetical protein [Caulobacter sp. 17J65-9]NEX94573.1 hypothetical protein [Caulobacter sp. 17J65-9]